MCDERFASPDARSHLPVWMRSGVRVYNTFGPAMKETSDFFRSAQSKYPALLSKLTGSQTATMTGQSCAPNSLKRQFLASLKSPGDGFQFPCASNHISTWAESLAPGGVTGDFLQSYTPQQPEACSVTAEAKEESTNSSNSVLDRVYCNIEKSSMVPRAYPDLRLLFSMAANNLGPSRPPPPFLLFLHVFLFPFPYLRPSFHSSPPLSPFSAFSSLSLLFLTSSLFPSSSFSVCSSSLSFSFPAPHFSICSLPLDLLSPLSPAVNILTPAEPFKRPASDDLVAGKPRDDDDGDAALEARLLNHHQAAKRIKLVKQHINPETGGSLSPADYLQSVKRLFQNASPDKENRSFKDFKSALLTYKASEKEKGLSAVQRVFTSLANLFIPNDAPGLLRDFIVFVRESEKPRYAELCKGLTGLATASGSKDGGPSPAVSASSEVAKPSSSSKAVALSCARCKKTPIPDPLRAPCSHICCFPCWRSIIEQVALKYTVVFVDRTIDLFMWLAAGGSVSATDSLEHHDHCFQAVLS
ncbi:unnamed protein product [Mesocestoides corti]|uniref:Uncharacterized protein n=1 Tax=Mesocestoides corti TaxID=53468 RepID=A0A3P6GQE8_MESCO|nr:unnamed protein product [Mesocestoides corti]